MSNFLKIWVELSLAKIVVLRFYFRRYTFTVHLGNLLLSVEPPTLQPTCYEKGN